MGETEHVVDEEQNVLALVAEVLGDGQAGERDTGARARRFVHLAEHQRAARALPPALHVDIRLDHLVIEVVAFAGAFADAGKDRIAAIGLGDVVDQLMNQHGLADAGAAEQADLAALCVRAQQIDNLDAGHENFRDWLLIDEGWRGLVNGALRRRFDRARFIHRLADDVQDAAERLFADRHRDWRAGVDHILAAHQTVGCVHGDRAHGGFPQVRRHFQNQAIAAVRGFKRIVDIGQITVELDVDDGADYLRHAALDLLCHLFSSSSVPSSPRGLVQNARCDHACRHRQKRRDNQSKTRGALHYPSTARSTGMLFRVALEYGQT